MRIALIGPAHPYKGGGARHTTELARWLAGEFGFSLSDAVLLLGQVAEARCTQLVNPHFTYVCKISKRYLTGHAVDR